MSKWQPMKQDFGMTNVEPAEPGTTSKEAVRSVSLTILGDLPSMKNSRRLLKNRRTGKIFSAKSDKAVAYVESFIAQIPLELRQMAMGSDKTPLRATVSVWHGSHRADLDCNLVYDCLQAAGVIANDRWIIEHHEYKHVTDPKEARVEIEVEEL